MSLFLAKEFDSEIILIHVIPEIKDFQMARGKIRKKVTDKLKHMGMDLKKKGMASVETITRFGIPFERIIEFSDELDVNLIVVGSGKGEKKFPLGTTAERVMIYADKPVLTVKPGVRRLIRKIVCPVDFSEASKRALTNAFHLSRTFEAHLTALTVYEPLLSSFFGPGRTPGESKEKALVKRQQYQYDRFLRGFESEDLTWTKIIRRGEYPERDITGIRRATAVFAGGTYRAFALRASHRRGPRHAASQVAFDTLWFSPRISYDLGRAVGTHPVCPGRNGIERVYPPVNGALRDLPWSRPYRWPGYVQNRLWDPSALHIATSVCARDRHHVVQ